ncbi:hypothetical protein Tco_1181411, partial [Tanacetum coccineum]
EITSLKLRVKKLEKKEGSRTHKLKILYKVGRSARVVSSDEASLGDQEDASKQGRKIDDIDKDAEDTAKKVINVAEKEVSTADPVPTAGEVVTTASVEVSSPTEATISNELTLAQTLIEIKSAKPKVKRVVIGEQSESITKTRPQQLPSKDKGKGIMEEPRKPTKKKDQIRLDEELAFRLQAEEVEEVRLTREKAEKEQEANVALIEEWDDIQAKIKADQKKRAEEKRNKPPTKVQKRNIMSTYLKNMAGYKHNQLKNKSFDDIQKLFDKEMKRVNTFVDMDTELVEESSKRTEITQESSSKRAGDELEQERIKKQKMDEDKESTKLQRKIGYFQIIRADGSSKRYSAFIQMLKSFDMEDLETLWKLVKAKHGSTMPEEGYERVLWGNLKIMSEHHIEDTV